MNKGKTKGGVKSFARTQHSFSYETKAERSPVASGKPDDILTSKAVFPPSGTLDVRQMIEDAARVSDHIENGGKLEELSEIRFFRPSGLFDK